MTDREKILIALREKPLKAFQTSMKRVNIKHVGTTANQLPCEDARRRCREVRYSQGTLARRVTMFALSPAAGRVASTFLSAERTSLTSVQRRLKLF